MVTEAELLEAVEAAFVSTRGDLSVWPDPHPGLAAPRDEEYSRVTDPARWRIVGARADAWMAALVAAGLAAHDADPAVEWAEPPSTQVTRVERLVPVSAGAMPLVLARSALGGVDDAGVTIGAGEPAVAVAWLPYCGCDACDSGAEHELRQLDVHLLDIVTGTFRRLLLAGGTVTVVGDGWRASGVSRRTALAAIEGRLAGVTEVSGTTWFSPGREDQPSG